MATAQEAFGTARSLGSIASGVNTLAGGSSLATSLGLSALATPLAIGGIALGALGLVKGFGGGRSVGPNFNLRFSGQGGQVIGRAVGVDNKFPRETAEAYMGDYASRLNAALQATGGQVVEGGLEGTFGFNRDFEGFFARGGGGPSKNKTGFENLDDAFKHWVRQQVNEGLITGVDKQALIDALPATGEQAATAVQEFRPETFAEFREGLASGVYDTDLFAAPATLATAPPPATLGDIPTDPMELGRSGLLDTDRRRVFETVPGDVFDRALYFHEQAQREGGGGGI